MDIQLNEFQLALQSGVRKFVEQDVIPDAMRYEHNDEYPHVIVNKMKDLGYFGALVPEEFGGSQMDAMSLVVFTEELSDSYVLLL